jgi:Plasmid pRiA4b ORF-3-like protein
MRDTRAEIDEAIAVVRWLLEAGLDGLGLTKTHALRRAIVREAAERWPHWWRQELFGSPHRESDLPVLAEVHAALRRLRLMRRRRETLLTTARGRELLADPGALVKLLHDDLGGDGFDGDAWLLIEEVLHEHGRLESDRLTVIVGRLLAVEGWRDADGARLEGWALFGALQPVLCRAEGYGLVRRHREPLRFELTAAGEGLAALEPPVQEPITAAPGDAALVFDAELLNVRGVRARLAVLERQPLTALHDAIQQAFGWFDDHLYSFWLDGSFLGSDEVELTTPDTPDEGVATADVPLAELDLHLGRRIGYVFDFGDEWRVRLTVRERVTAEPGDHPRVLELRSTPPPQYAALDDWTS